MKHLLSCQKVRHIFFLSTLAAIYTFSSLVYAGPKGVSVSGTIESLNELDNAYEVRLTGSKRTLLIPQATEFKQEDLVLLKESFEKKTPVSLTVKGKNIVAIKSLSSPVATSEEPVKPAGKVAALGKPTVGGEAPLFATQTHEGKEFKFADRKGKWTVLYFYPKAETPGCTKQACAFRDSIKVITALNADVFGISADSVADQAAFHKNHSLTFTLLADPDAKVIEQYGVKMPAIKMAKRWTFIIGPDLKIRHIDEGVDPVKDAGNVAKKLKELQG